MVKHEKPRCLVVFYSRTGTTKKLGEAISKTLDCAKEGIIDTKERSGAIGWLTGGRDATLERTTSINKIKKHPLAYDAVILGTPVWSWNMTPAIRTYIRENKESFENVAFFCTFDGSGDKRTFKKMEKECGKKPVAMFSAKRSEIGNFRRAENGKHFRATTEIINGAYKQKLKKFLAEILKVKHRHYHSKK